MQVCGAEGLIYHMTPPPPPPPPPKEKNSLCFGELWPLFVKGVKISLHNNWLSVLAERKVPQRSRWCDDEFMINYDGYGLCCV